MKAKLHRDGAKLIECASVVPFHSCCIAFLARAMTLLARAAQLAEFAARANGAFMKSTFAMLGLLVLACSPAASTPTAPVQIAVDAGRDLDSGAPSVPDSASADVAAPADALPTLFVGNSYVFVGDVAGQYRGFLDVRGGQPSRIEQALTAGYSLADHAQEARADGTPIARWLRTDALATSAFSYVVLQEQSIIGAILEGQTREASLAAALELSKLAEARGAETLLYATRGRRDGLADRPGMDTFEAMEAKLELGYSQMATYLISKGARARVAPVGKAFRVIYENATSAGRNPVGSGELFQALYESDGSHPSRLGSYLAGCVLARTATMSPAAQYVDPNVLPASRIAELRTVCEQVTAP
jgi:hypothetical protein